MKNQDTVRELCEYVIRLQESGRHVPGHAPRSGVFADCSMACRDECLAFKARDLLYELNEDRNG